MDPQLLSSISDLSGTALIILALLGGAKGWWIWGWQHREAVAELQERIAHEQDEARFWRDTALEALQVAQRATDAAERRSR